MKKGRQIAKMNIFDSVFKTKKQGSLKLEGYIGYFGLGNWWLSEFTEEERQHIEHAYHPMGHPPEKKPLTQGTLSSTSRTASNMLNGLSSWFTGPEYRHIARKILSKAQELNHDNGNIKNVLDEHFTLSEMIPVYYRDRDSQKGMFEKTIDACRQLISLAPQAVKAFLEEYPGQALPSHRGYEQLSIILKKQEKTEEAITVCNQALQQGWAGDWEKRIERYKRN